MRSLTLVLFFIITSCASRPFSHGSSEHKALALLWIQNAAEYRALSHQAYNMAIDRLREALSNKRKGRPLAVVLDIDETVLDNMPFEVSNLLSDKAFDMEAWDNWVEMKKARALPGVVRFTNEATKLGVEVFYVSNRRIKGLESTYQNMVEQGLSVKRENIYLKTTTSSKLDRRATILERYDIALLIGDNLIDFHERFENLSSSDRSTFVDSYSQEFGRRLIVIPNPIYGDWLDAIYESANEPNVQARKRREKLYPIP